MVKCKLLNAFQLKLLLISLMVLDHLRFINNFVTPDIQTIFSVISRGIAPMFAYFAVEGIRHTQNLKKYCLRLSAGAIIMYAGNAVLKRIFMQISNPVPDNVRMLLLNNIFFTLAAGVIAIALIQWGKNKQAAKKGCIYMISSILFVIGFLYGEWGSVILPFMFIEYFFSSKKRIRFLGYVMIEVIALILPFGEPLWFLVFPFIWLYNGKRGLKNGFSKFFFYIFYPAHLWIIAIINLLAII